MFSGVTATEAKHIARLPKADGQRALARHLHLSDVDLEDDLRQGSFVDYHYDVLQFSTNRGMPWKEVASSLMFAHTFFKHLVEESFSEAVHALHNLATLYVETDRLRLDSTKKLVQYMMSFVLSQYKLYQFVFNQEREDQSVALSLSVEVPESNGELKEAQPLQLWEYEHRMKNIKGDEYNLMLDIQAKEEKVAEKSKQIEAFIDEKIKEKEMDSKINLSQAESFVSSIVTEKLDVLVEDTNVELKKMKNATDIALAIKAIPVPPGVEQHHAVLPSEVLMKEKHSRRTSARSAASSHKRSAKKSH